MVDPINVTNVQFTGRSQARDPKLQDVAVSYLADFASPASYNFDFTTVNQLKLFGIPKTLFIDNGSNPNTVDVSISITGQAFTIPANSAGFWTLTAAASSIINLESTGGASNKCVITVFNYNLPPVVWYSFGAFNIDAPLMVEGSMDEGDTVATEAANNPAYIGGIDRGTGLFHGIAVGSTGKLQVDVTTVPANGAYTDRSIANLSGASEQLMAANASRKSLVIMNIAGNNMGVNFVGGAAAIGTAGTITLVPGSMLVFDTNVPTGAVNIIGTANDDVTAYEG